MRRYSHPSNEEGTEILEIFEDKFLSQNFGFPLIFIVNRSAIQALEESELRVFHVMLNYYRIASYF